MNGAAALPPSMIRNPRASSIKIIGPNHHFLLVARKPHSSEKILPPAVSRADSNSFFFIDFIVCEVNGEINSGLSV